MYTEPMTHTEQTETVPTLTAADAGCWFDGAMGWHNTYRVIYAAQDYGFPLSAEDQAMVDTYAAGDFESYGEDYEALYEISNEATDYLQSIAPEGYSFVWEDGFYLWADEDTDENGGWIGE